MKVYMNGNLSHFGGNETVYFWKIICFYLGKSRNLASTFVRILESGSPAVSLASKTMCPN
jgi:hypothetical protein